MTLWLALLANAPAGPGVEIDVDDDDPGMQDFVELKKRKPPEPVHAHLYPEGHTPLADDWAIYLAAHNERYVVLELPVLVATSRAAFAAAYPHGLWLIGEYTSGGAQVAIEQRIRAGSVLEEAPTFAFLKAALPNPKPVDEVRVVVKTAALPAPAAEGEPAPETPAPKVRFARTTVYSR